MVFKAPGGHSFQEFGLPSATHAMGRAIAKIANLQTPSDPKTTFTVGTVRGGTSVNAIASEARMAVDMRSNSTEELLKLEARLLDLVREAAEEENKRWDSDKVTVEINLIGVGQPGSLPRTLRSSRRRGGQLPPSRARPPSLLLARAQTPTWRCRSVCPRPPSAAAVKAETGIR